ncbi:MULTISPECIES: hypothetical protein [unclassified Mesorhizobium]|uniref:hypothetical protein n=1 Tax=unclassified Mesorhizobium TaxID=325217 RepID=UPI000FE9850D|nr:MULTISPECIES: hypothetical protein [unclassified Mesorhizobium]RWB94711.1 MAG: hypothetical protein EOQ57_31245 [Mesorhizobium sp.]TGV18205.1 hypothetical protein EN786_34635 [Mesorhizobium sp. M4B.F.Ca.ET.143.01.1.1]
MISLPDCKITETDGHLVLSPERVDWPSILAFDRSVKAFLSFNPEYEVLIHHASSERGNGEWDMVTVKPPS